MFMFLLVSLLAFRSTEAQGFGIFGCISEEFCDCSGEEVVCTDHDQKATLNVGLIFSEPFTNLTIRGFRRVILNNHFLHATKPRTVLFTNITMLQIKAHAFLSSEVVDLEISHIRNLMLETYALTNLANVTRILLHNVTCKYMPSYVVSLHGMDLSFIIEGSNFGMVYSSAMQIFEASRFVMNNTKIDNADRHAFNITGADFDESTVVFSNVSFGRLSQHSFTVDYVFDFTIRDCDFGTIDSFFLSGDRIQVFGFFSNAVNTSDHHSFEDLDATKYIFRNNSFNNLYNISLPFYDLPDAWVFEDNKFQCDCDSSWLFNVSSVILEHNFCTSNTTTSSLLAEMEPVWKNDQECIGLQKRSFVPNRTTPISSTSQPVHSQHGSKNVSKTNTNGCTVLAINTSTLICLVYAAFATLV